MSANPRRDPGPVGASRRSGIDTVEVNGTQLAYLDQGAGEPVVFVHGSIGDLRSWTPQMEVFSQHYRAIAYSRRHHFPNPASEPDRDYSATLHADDLAAFIAALGIDSAHVVGNSYGAYTALVLAARHPERVRTLVLGEPPLLPLLEHHVEGRALRNVFLAEVWGPAGKLLARGEAEEGVRTFVDGLFEPGAFDQIPNEVHALIMDNAESFGLETASTEFWAPFTLEDARRVEAPTLLLSGEVSVRMLQLVVEELDACMAHARHVCIPASSHDLPAHRADIYNELVLGFLAEHLP